MARRSIFRDFIAELRKDWRTTFPSLRLLDRTSAAPLPKASTFAAGVVPSPGGMHVFLHFQHSAKSREVGSFTINVILARRPEDAELGFAGLTIDFNSPNPAAIGSATCAASATSGGS